MKHLFTYVIICICILAVPEPAFCSDSPSFPPSLSIRGYGLRGNRKLRNAIELLDTEKQREYYDAPFTEDAAFIMLSLIRQDGYLEPSIRTQLILADGTEKEYRWQSAAEVLLPRPSRAISVRFIIEPGVLFYYENIDICGLQSIETKQAKTYFVSADFLMPLKSTRIFTPDQLNRSISNLRQALVDKGYKNAEAVAAEIFMDKETGAVSVSIEVNEGKKHVIRRIKKDILYPEREAMSAESEGNMGMPFTRRRVQDAVIDLRNRFQRKGYADVTVEAKIEETVTEGEQVMVDLSFKVSTGPKIYLEAVSFRGHEKTRESVLKRQIEAEPGEELNRLELERGRYRLARLGVFDSVDLSYEKTGPDERKAVYTLAEGEEVEASLMLGYGSYELLRCGIELAQKNLFGRAHRSRLLGIQSVKSTSIDYSYTIPHIFRRNMNAFYNVSALRRREVDFLRKEYSGTTGVRTYSSMLRSNVTFRYTYQSLESDRFDGAEEYGMKRALVGSVGLGLEWDRRDNPVSPRAGYNISTGLNVASPVLLGDADFQQLKVRSAWHRGLGRGMYLHLAFSHGVIHTSGRVRNNLPFNKRFFPGGHNSIRGYQSGEAAPRDAGGNLIGAETFMLGSMEFEQMLTPSWSMVFFTDGLAMAADLKNYPSDETLFSVGGGVRYNTFMGPLRVEYGHNPSPRSGDPSGTLHISVGFPF